jgi:hypothetical protein
MHQRFFRVTPAERVGVFGAGAVRQNAKQRENETTIVKSKEG